MSWSQPANRRLLCSILHSPYQSVPNRVLGCRTAGRYFSISSNRSDIAHSGFSFGEEGDHVITELAKKRKRDATTPSTASKDLTKEVGVEAGEKEVPATVSPAHQKTTAGLSHEPDLRAQELKAATDYVRGLQKHSAGAQDRRRTKAASLKSAESGARKRVPAADSADPVEGKTAKSRPRAKEATTIRKRGPLAELVRKQSAGADVPKDPVKEAAAARLEAARADPDVPAWKLQKLALTAKFGSEGWNPRRKLSPDAMLGIRTLHQDDPATYTTPVLAQQFKVSAEAIRRILKSKWLPKSGPDKVQEMRERWAKRHDRIWDTKSELGLRPKREEGQAHRVRDASEGAEEVEHSLWADETLERARKDDPLVQKRFQEKAKS